MDLHIEARKTPTCWVFDHEHQSTIDEALCNGTEKVIDFYYESIEHKTPIIGDKIGFTLSTDIHECDTRIDLKETSEYGSYYIDEMTQMEVWLCPWLQGYFGEVPQKIYIDCYSISNEMNDEELDQYCEQLNYVL